MFMGNCLLVFCLQRELWVTVSVGSCWFVGLFEGQVFGGLGLCQIFGELDLWGIGSLSDLWAFASLGNWTFAGSLGSWICWVLAISRDFGDFSSVGAGLLTVLLVVVFTHRLLYRKCMGRWLWGG